MIFIQNKDSAKSILYGLNQSPVEMNYATNFNDNKSSEQDKLLNASAVRTDLKLTVNRLTYFSFCQNRSVFFFRMNKSYLLVNFFVRVLA